MNNTANKTTTGRTGAEQLKFATTAVTTAEWTGKASDLEEARQWVDVLVHDAAQVAYSRDAIKVLTKRLARLSK